MKNPEKKTRAKSTTSRDPSVVKAEADRVFARVFAIAKERGATDQQAYAEAYVASADSAY